MTMLMTGLMVMNHEAAAQEPAATKAFGLTCNINGIPPQERARYGQLVEALRHAIQKRRELPDGYAFQMDTKQIGTDQLVEWIELETEMLSVLRVRNPLDPTERGRMAQSDRA
jgi:hypothetical protein